MSDDASAELPATSNDRAVRAADKVALLGLSLIHI